MSYVFDNERPIYLQVLEQLKIEIISNKYKPGTKLPSVRELSVLFKINPNTMQKALQELEEEKLIYTERTNGKFVTSNVKLIEKEKIKMIKKRVNDFLSDMNDIGVTREEIINYLERTEEK